MSVTYFLSGTAVQAVLPRILGVEAGRAENNYFDLTTLREWEGELHSVVARAVSELPGVEEQMGRVLLIANKAKSARAVEG